MNGIDNNLYGVDGELTSDISKIDIKIYTVCQKKRSMQCWAS